MCESHWLSFINYQGERGEERRENTSLVIVSFCDSSNVSGVIITHHSCVRVCASVWQNHLSVSHAQPQVIMHDSLQISTCNSLILWIYWRKESKRTESEAFSSQFQGYKRWGCIYFVIWWSNVLHEVEWLKKLQASRRLENRERELILFCRIHHSPFDEVV